MALKAKIDGSSLEVPLDWKERERERERVTAVGSAVFGLFFMENL